MVYRTYVEKKPHLANEAKALLADIRTLLGIDVKDIRIINRYDVKTSTKSFLNTPKAQCSPNRS